MSTSPSDQEPSCKTESEASLHQAKCLTDFRNWIQTEAPFFGRTDEEYLLMFLRACEFDLELTMQTMTKYYECRTKIPQWWANRDLNDPNINAALQQKVSTALIDRETQQPTVVITPLSRMGSTSITFDDYFKLGSILFDTVARRYNTQLNGISWIIDCRDYKLSFALRLLSPLVAKNFVHSFLLAAPVRIVGLFILNAPAIILAFYNLIRPYLHQKLTEKFHFIGNDWSHLYDRVPRELLPEEYGGLEGPMERHEEAFLQEASSFTEFIIDDNKYGFQNKA